jgi:dipeptidyl aminopeptidase/acylaminoacyl peptidase
MKKIILLALVVTLSFLAGWYLNLYLNRQTSPDAYISRIKPRPLDKYTIDNLAKADITPAKISIERALDESDTFKSYLFSFKFNPAIRGRQEKKVTGLINLPNATGKYPVIVMFRGYVDQSIYKTGIGTQRAGEFFASRGFITIAPDFLGYSESDSEAANIFESRFQTYTTAMVLLKSLGSIEQWDGVNVFIWGHSNGGQIALTVLEATGEAYPTILWAPVSKPFPYSILYYTDESDDRGKLIRKELAGFEETYDVELYSIVNYYDRIKAPVQLHQGTEDDAVPKVWSDSLAKSLLDLNLDIDYYVYPGADHNLNPSWNTVVERDLDFFRSQLD